MTEAITDNGFLDGRIRIYQPSAGYRAATDPVLLAASVRAKAGDHVLELGCGVGVALACLLHRVDVQATGLELQQAYADLAQRNMARNGLTATITVGNLLEMPKEIKAQSFDEVFMNPPFYKSDDNSAPENPSKATAFLEGSAGVQDWISVGLKRLKPRGYITIIHRSERLAEILAALGGAGDIRILPLAAREGRAAGRVLVRARKTARAPLRLLAPLVLHAGNTHTEDGDDFSEIAKKILRDGQALDL